ncbi:MAG: bifunctional UDP-N-acetylmuramoyl-tripeptide:D-alanyl-D-alanine ligase/alanine racemase [Prevotella sp.]|nr:bifunctional UDP-N-acetylmuramoyl-tripeptide:D-alanyl-D-alanine ligase/alanine racemase [Prevotella sp.]
MTYTIEKIATLIGARRYGEADATVGWLLTDSRSLCFPEQTLFFALTTKVGDGHRYISELYRRGVRSFVVEQIPENYEALYPEANFLRVPSSLAALQRLAERHRDEFDIPVVGITGSNGKTWVKEWLYQLLRTNNRRVTRSPRSFNSQIGVPLSVWLLNAQTQVALFEAGISEPGEMLPLSDIIQPTIGVFTSLGTAHQENFRTLEEKCLEKMQLFQRTKAIIYPSDDDTISRCMRRCGFQGERIGWSRYNDKAPFYVVSILTDNITHIFYIYNGVEGSYAIPFSDEASIENSITCAATALYLGLSPEEVAKAMAVLEPIAMRLEVKEGQRGLKLINDSYNNDLQSLDIALDFMGRRGEANSHKTLILSDIYQSGESPQELYHQVADLIAKRGVDKFIGVGPEISSQADLFTLRQKWFFPDVSQLLRSEVFADLHDEVVLLKGARRFGFERISEMLEQKVHETILEVDLNAVVANLDYYRSLLRPETKMVCMIKADAYGAGAIEIAKTLQDHRVDYLAVAVADEGAELRKAGITQNIIVMNPEMSSFKTLFDYGLEPEVYSFRLMDALIRAARSQGITGWPVHIKLDTGMHRLGFEVGQMHELIDRLTHQQAIIPRSVFTHFVGSDSPDFDAFSARQFQLFDEASRELQAAFSHKILRHIDNSAGIEHFPERQLDMCRLGIGLYTHTPVSTLITTILQLRHVPKEETVGYSRRGTLTRDSIIAAIPIGYADGLDRRLGNRNAYCLVNGQRAEYVGNICMDVALIDVTDIPCREGDQVEVFGQNLPVTVLSDVMNTIPYEVLTSVSNRVKRVYFQC